ncbi:MAG: cytochrome P450 [Thermoleophilaceae bacterium]|nr:cytochrome P450 [Thermoleophilaceae bacterium]
MRQRKLLLPPFHGEALRAYEERITEIAMHEIARWPRGDAFAIRPRTQAITLQVILEVIFGVRDADRRDQYSHVIDRLMKVANFMGVNAKNQDESSKRSAAHWIRPRRDAVDKLIYEDLHRRRADPAADGNDILSMLLAARDEDGRPMTDSELRDELVTLLFAGHETTATALAWATDLLVWNPAVMARATLAAREGDDVYLDALVNETLRIRPVVWSTGRVTQEPMQIGEWVVPKGTRLWSPMTVLAADGKIYDDPDEFKPERFVDVPPPPYAWIPFGGGIRRCIGASFAALEMRIVLREMLLAGSFASAGRRPERSRLRNVTLAPARGTRVRFTPAQAASAPPREALEPTHS